MDELLFNFNLLVELSAQTVLLVLTLYALIYSIQIAREWDFNSTSNRQYELEKKSFLVATIITVTLIFNIFLLPYFVFTIDRLHSLVPGAMCAAGVIGANSYGYPLLVLKISTILLSLIWLVLNRVDLSQKDYPYTKKRFYLYIFIAFLMIVSLILEIAYFSSISTTKSVVCCSVTFGLSGDNSLPFGLNQKTLFILYLLLFTLNITTAKSKNPYLLLLSTIFFSYISYYAIINIFGPYIYELPTHICPFCMLQKEYHYVGYLVWGVWIGVLFYGVVNGFLKLFIGKEIESYYTKSFYVTIISLVLNISFILIYYIKNGTLL